MIFNLFNENGSKIITRILRIKDAIYKNYIIESIRGFLDFPNDIQACLEKKKEMKMMKIISIMLENLMDF